MGSKKGAAQYWVAAPPEAVSLCYKQQDAVTQAGVKDAVVHEHHANQQSINIWGVCQPGRPQGGRNWDGRPYSQSPCCPEGSEGRAGVPMVAQGWMGLCLPIFVMLCVKAGCATLICRQQERLLSNLQPWCRKSPAGQHC